MAIQRTPMVDDDGTGEVGTVVNNDWKVELYNQIDASLLGTRDVEVFATAETIPTLNPAYRRHIVRFYGTALYGFAKTDAQDGDEVIVINATGGNIIDMHDSSTSATVGNRLANFATSAPTRIQLNGAARYVRDYNWAGASTENKWRLVSHEQGGPITAPFSAANFTSNVGSWTVSAGNMHSCEYVLRGRTLHIWFYLETTSASGSPGSLRIHLNAFGGYSIPRNAVNLFMVNDAGATAPGYSLVGPAVPGYLNLSKVSLTGFTGNVSNLYVYGQMAWPVT